MPWSRIALKINGLTAPITASMTTSTRNQNSCRLYGAAKRMIRRTVPRGNVASFTDLSLRNEAAMCQLLFIDIRVTPSWVGNTGSRRSLPGATLLGSAARGHWDVRGQGGDRADPD